MLHSIDPSVDYKEVLKLSVCDIDRFECMLHHCDSCPDESVVREFLKQQWLKKKTIEDSIKYKQWVSTDRSNLEEHEDEWEDFINKLSAMIFDLTEHHFIAKRQSSFFKEKKFSLKGNEAVIVLDFAENYSFVVQDCAQGYHWNNAQATIHPFVMYFKCPETNELSHSSYACISDHMVHDTNTVYCFLSVLINNQIKVSHPFIEKIYYFSDGCAAQYKNYKNFTNLLMHKIDFDLEAEWHFFATSHGKNACDGVGGTIKRLAARTSLQRCMGDQILDPKQLFDFAQKQVPGVTSLFVEKSEVVKAAEFLAPRFENAQRFKGTRKNHQFVPHENNILMSRISGHNDLTESSLIEESTNLIEMDSIMPGQFYKCQYENDWFFGVANFVSIENKDVNVKFMHPKGPALNFFWPTKDDTCWVPISNVLCRVNPPKISLTGRFYIFDDGSN